MPFRKIRLCEVFGIPLYLDMSLMFLLLMFATNGGRSFFSGMLMAALLLVSITAHELGHSLTARRFGFGTRGITLSMIGGCASLDGIPRKPMQEFLVALAGPAVSFALAFLCFLLVQLFANGGNAFSLGWACVTSGLFDHSVMVATFKGGVAYVSISGGQATGLLMTMPMGAFWIVDALIDVACMNAMLGAFNLLPGFPMDGGRIFRSSMRAFMTRERATYVAMYVGRIFAVLLGIVALRRIFNGASWGWVTVAIAVMIWLEGRREYLQTLMEERWSYSARVSPPPYGGDEEDVEVRKRR